MSLYCLQGLTCRTSQTSRTGIQSTTLKKTAVRRKKLPIACRASARRQAQTPVTRFPNHAVSGRRDDRAMMTPGCAGRSELPFTSFPTQPKSAHTSARRTQSRLHRYLPANVSRGKVDVKSRRLRRSVRLYSTEEACDDLTRDCPRDAAALTSFQPTPSYLSYRECR